MYRCDISKDGRITNVRSASLVETMQTLFTPELELRPNARERRLTFRQLKKRYLAGRASFTLSGYRSRALIRGRQVRRVVPATWVPSISGGPADFRVNV